ncbi:single-stranded-DNA-specific exonuclease RecJ [Litorimonas sp. RW-G-Af-16]|uniref:single-stranded-DNA-specific exonuclease RecJ n=1 Tax=Litorimonas sp. RW-G-Af-16 TaxID=3241168 RepID=UPI00390C44BB
MRCEDDALEAFVTETNLPRLDAALLCGRGVSAENAETFLSPKLRSSLPDPSVMQDVDKAAARILDGIATQEKIWIFSDYDVDGGTSAAQMIRWGRAIGYEFKLYIPDRIKEGYGPTEEAFQSLKDQGADLVITMDCGAAAYEALHHAAEIDLSVIVVDHHLMHTDMPPAFAIVNPNRQDDSSGLGHLAAAGVTFMLIVALNRLAKARGLSVSFDLRNLLGLTALGTICDVVPLTGVNRTFVRQGLKVLSRNDIVGIEALADVADAKPPYSTYHAGFVLGPRLNAGGRIGRADMGAELLSTENAQTAYAHAAELDRVNAERRAMQDKILTEALEMGEAKKNHSVIIVAMEDWHAGIIGIVAGRLKDRFGKPTIVIGIDQFGQGKGSGRSIKGVNLGGAISAAKEAGLLVSGGGHEMAGGLSIEPDKLEDFEAFMLNALSDDVALATANPSRSIDAIISVSAVNLDMLDTIERIGPYGSGNPQPVFALADLRLSYAQRLKGNHVRFSFTDRAGQVLSGICFRADESGLADALLDPNPASYHVIGQIRENLWKGRRKVDFHLIDMARTKES